MKKAGLVESTGRGKIRITARGLEVLEQNPSRLDVKFLEKFPEFLEFRRQRSREHDEGGVRAEAETEAEAVGSGSQTPAEVLEDSYAFLRRELADELLVLEKVKSSSPQFFEKLVVDLLIAMGYGGSRRDAGEAIGRSSDGGIDGVIKEDRLGLDAVYIQAKRWDSTVGRPIVQAFVGSLEGQKARKGVLLTTSRFSADAIDYAQRVEKRVVLIDGEHLAQLMIDFGVGVAEVASYTIKKVDLDYFA